MSDVAGVNRDRPVSTADWRAIPAGLTFRYRPREVERLVYALQTAAAFGTGLRPDVLEDTYSWGTVQVLPCAIRAAVMTVRARERLAGPSGHTGVNAEEERRFEEVVASRYDTLRRAAFVLVGDQHHAEDLAQTVFLKLHRGWRRIDLVEDLDAYLHVALVNASRSWWKRHWHGERATEQLPDIPIGGQPEGLVDLRDALVRALGALGRDHREVLVLRHIAGLTEAETAAVLCCSVGTVKSRNSRALAALRGSGAFHDSTVRTP